LNVEDAGDGVAVVQSTDDNLVHKKANEYQLGQTAAPKFQHGNCVGRRWGLNVFLDETGYLIKFD
jgi:hypothetical protein